MKTFSNQEFSTWSGVRIQTEMALEPQNQNQIDEIFASKQPFSIRGMGKNYTDAGLNKNKIILNRGLRSRIEFNPNTGVIRVDSGVVLHDLLLWSLPQNWIVPTIPGTAYVSVGGMLASNVHGKNQFQVGSVGDYVEKFTLRTPAMGLLNCSITENRDIFDATIGGMGTTGLIETVDLKLLKLKQPFLRSSYQKMTSISQMMEFMESKRSESDFTIGWMAQDTLDGDRVCGLVEHANYTEEPVIDTWDPKHPLKSVNVPFYFPFCPVNSFTTKIFNKLVYAKPYPTAALIHFYEFNFKLDKIKNWNRVYGRKGFIQYQCLIPRSNQTSEHLQYVLSFLSKHDVLSSLVVVKMHKKDKSGYLSFSQDGISVAMDFPYTDRNIEVLRKLTPWVASIGGRLYLTKDRTMDHTQFHDMYGNEIARQRKVLAKVDPEKMMQSEFTKRLRIHHE